MQTLCIDYLDAHRVILHVLDGTNRYRRRPGSPNQTRTGFLVFITPRNLKWTVVALVPEGSCYSWPLGFRFRLRLTKPVAYPGAR
eukprot:2486869-Rhodomonas_salina.1